MAKAQQQPNPQPQVPAQPANLDYRQHYQQQHGVPAQPMQMMPYGQQQLAYNPYGGYYNRGWFRNPLTGGQWLMIIGGAVMIGGLAYYGWVRYKQAKAAKAQQAGQLPTGNPAHVVRHLRPQHQQYYNRAA